MTPTVSNSDIVIVGGGPVGLWTAIQTRFLSGKNITILEKHDSYQRADVQLRIREDSLEGIPDDPRLKALVAQWGDKTVSIKKVEDSLAKLAHEVGITILRGEPVDPSKLHNRFPNAQVFIGADGARSSVRRAIFQDQLRFKMSHQYIAQVQYKVRPLSSNEPMSFIQKIEDIFTNYKMQKFAHNFIIENSYFQPDGSSHIVLQIFIDETTYSQIANATFRTPLHFDTGLTNLPDTLKDTMIRWWGAESELRHREIIPDNTVNKITAYALTSFAANEVVTCDSNRRNWALVGDAAVGLPFFRGINNGFLSGTKLAHCIAHNPEDLSSYSCYMTLRILTEQIWACVKSFFLSLAIKWVEFTSHLMWQPIAFDSDSQQHFLNRGNQIWNQLLRS